MVVVESTLRVKILPSYDCTLMVINDDFELTTSYEALYLFPIIFNIYARQELKIILS
jgi:hypothetical protein